MKIFIIDINEANDKFSYIFDTHDKQNSVYNNNKNQIGIVIGKKHPLWYWEKQTFSFITE